jgi:hypothetical protein
VLGSRAFFFFQRGLIFMTGQILVLVMEPVLFINLNVCGQFWGKIWPFSRNRPESAGIKNIGGDVGTLAGVLSSK